MRRSLSTLVLSLAVATVALPLLSPSLALAADPSPSTQPASPATTSSSADVPVKIVVLYSSGVGYFQHAGSVSGNASTSLLFKTDQINDILKSLVLQDLDHGRISTITYPSQDPVEKTLASFQINLSSNPSLHDLLNQLRGSRVELELGAADKVSGTILGVEMKPRPTRDDEKKVIELPVLNLLTDSSLRSIDLEQVRSVHLDDPELNKELSQALAALAQARDKDKKPVTINFEGAGLRRVSIGYVVESPVWKTSYRLVLSPDPKIQPQLQGWAIVENQTDSDWNNVQLSLVSGRPMSFIQDLYQPLYIPRPVVQSELYASLVPPTYAEGMEQKEALGAVDRPVAGAIAGRRQRALKAPAAVAAPAAPGLAGDAMAKSLAETPVELGIPAQPLNVTASISSLASASKLGELFQYTLPSVSLPRQKSAMLPIVTDSVEAERVSIYNASVLPTRPLNGALLKNTSGKNLLAGPVTVFDASSYAGDARIDNTPPNASRLLSFGVDLQTLVNSSHNATESHILTGKIVKGVLELSNRTLFTQDYVADNKSDKDKSLIIEHPVRQNWKLLAPDKPMETTESLYRFRLPLPAEKQAKLTVQQEIVQGQSIAILPCDLGQLAFYARSGEIPQPVRDALGKAIELKQALVDTERSINEKTALVDSITQEQTRIRENMKVVSPQSQYYNRLMSKLNDQESQLDQLRTDLDTLRTQLNTRRSDLEKYLSSLTLG